MKEYPQARMIVETLAKAGFVAYYAGGWVRDFLLQHPSDDIDIATNAPPETIQALFPHTVPIGIAFGIILVIIDGHQYEVATFRQDLEYQDGRRPTRITFTTAEEDAKRRDFTINGMFYDPIRAQVLDYVGGQEDLGKKIIRAIGNPHERIKEDRLRMMRAVRLSCRFGFLIDSQTAEAIYKHAKELFPAVAIERVFQELTKGHNFGKLYPMLIQLHEFGLLASIFPTLQEVSSLEIKTRLAPIQDYPANAPVIASLLPLFPEMREKDALQLCQKLKLAKIDQQFVVFLFRFKEMIARDQVELFNWAHLYSSPFAEVSLQIIGAHLHPQDQETFFSEHKKRIHFLKRSIERIQQQNPVVKSSDLLKVGIVPGKEMGALLKEAERIAINEQIEVADVVIARLLR